MCAPSCIYTEDKIKTQYLCGDECTAFFTIFFKWVEQIKFKKCLSFKNMILQSCISYYIEWIAKLMENTWTFQNRAKILNIMREIKDN